MSLNDLREEFDPEISAIADELNNSLPMSKPQIRRAFSDDDIKNLHSLIKEVNEATDANDKIVVLQEQAMTVLELLKKLGVGI
jgi:hypothetical protein